MNCPAIWLSVLHDSWQVSGEYVGVRYVPEEMPEKFIWPLRFTQISEHGYYLPHMHTDTYLPHIPHTASSLVHKSITWLTSALMMLLTLMRTGTRSQRQLTILIMEISHLYPHNKPPCQWVSHQLTRIWRVFCVYACGGLPDSSQASQSHQKQQNKNTICSMWRVSKVIYT